MRHFMKNANYTILFGFIIILIILIISSNYSPIHRWGDTSTYYMQIDSIEHEFDIKYEYRDIKRAFANRFDDLPAGLHLVANSEGELFYGKEYTYALFASPFFSAFGTNGILLFNAFMFFLMICMGYIYLRFENPQILSFLLSSSFFFMSTCYLYIYWIHAEIYNLFLIMSGLFFWFIYIRNTNDIENYKHKWAIFVYFSAVIFSLATFAKTPNLVCILPIIIYEIYSKRFKNVIFISIVFCTTTIFFYMVYYFVTGNINPYNLQYVYLSSTGYPFWDGNEYNCGYPMLLGESLFKSSIFSLSGFYLISHNLFYYFFGRFTGTFWYYPFSILSIYCLICTISKRKLSNIYFARFLIAVSIIINIFIYLYLSYENPYLNYFGGSHAVGNRYFYIYPAFLFLIGSININKKTLTVFTIVAIICLSCVVPIILTPIETSASPIKHTNYLPYRAMPLEYTLIQDLPLWNPLPIQFNGTKLYFPNSDINVDDDIIIIKQTYPELIFLSKELKSADVYLLNPSGAKTVTLVSGKSKKEINFSKIGTMRENITLEPVIKLEGDIYIYKLEIFVRSIQSYNEEIIINFSPFDTELIYPLSGWHAPENWSGITTRWISDEAFLLIYSDVNRTTDVSFEALSFYRPRKLDIYFNDQPWMRTNVPTEGFVMVNIPLKIDVGVNILKLYIPDGCDSPSKIPGLKSDDKRCLSLAIQNVTINYKDESRGIQTNED